MVLALNSPKMLMCHKTKQATNQLNAYNNFEQCILEEFVGCCEVVQFFELAIPKIRLQSYPGKNEIK